MLLLYVTEEVLLRCSQTGRKIKARVGDLSREDMRPLSEEDLVKGSRLIADVEDSTYPVDFVEFTGMSTCYLLHA